MSFSRTFSPRTSFGVVLIALICPVGCKEAPKKDAAPSPSVVPAAPADTATPAPGTARDFGKEAMAQAAADAAALPPKPVISIVETGAEPQVIRYTFQKDQKKKFSLKLTVKPEITVSGQKMPDTPKTSFEVQGTNTTEEVLADGTARRTAAFEKFSPGTAGLPEAARAQLKAQLGALEGVKIQELISPRGEVRGVEVIEMPAQNPGIYQLLENLQDGLSNAVLPLPEGAVGKGARWSATQNTRASGMQISQTTHFTLRDIKGQRLIVDVVFEQAGSPSKLEAAGLPPGASIELVSLKGSGKGTAEVDLKTLNMQSEVAITMDMHTRTIAPGAPGPIDSQTHNQLTVTVRLQD